MFDEEGRKIDFGYQIGMNLQEMSIEELRKYLEAVESELKRIENEIQTKKTSAELANSFFK